MRARAGLAVLVAGALALAGCGGDSSGSSTTTTTTPATTTALAAYAVPAQLSLSVGDVQQVVAQAVAQAKADNKPAVIAVTDRVGNVLALFRMTGAPANAHISDAPNGVNADVQGLNVPAEAAAIAKAVTGAYLSSGGNAFSSRTASMIVQTTFPPAPNTTGLGSGPLYGVQFSQLPCSDLASRFGASGAGGLIGPKRSPLGLAADPGGFPLYKNGVVVGGVGVIGDGSYGLDANVLDTDFDTDERAALAGTVGFEAPVGIRADAIYVVGTQLRYSDTDYSQLSPVSGATFAGAAALGTLEALTGYTAGAVLAGTAYGSEASGVRPASAAEFPNAQAFVLSDGSGNNRYPVMAGSDAAEVGTALTASEVQTVLAQAFTVMSRARAQIRQPLNSQAQVSITVVDTRGKPLGLVRAPDAPIFGIDVALQKARTAAFFSGSHAGPDLLADPSADVRSFVGAARSFLADPTALTGTHAFTDRANGDLHRPTFPDGSVGRPNGPFSRPAAQFNPFSTGLQSALIFTNLAQHLGYATGASASDTPRGCTFLPATANGTPRIANGVQIFPGSVPIYRGNQLVGGLGVSGDGIDQDDMISFYGLYKAGLALGSIGNAPPAIRADTIVITLSDGSTARLRYVSCPFAPFLDTSDQNVCTGI